VSLSKRPKTLPEFFDEWRSLYDYLTYEQFINLYSSIYSIVRNNLEPYEPDKFAIANFFHNIDIDANVVEYGSWNGSIASTMLQKFDHIIDWTGIEICREVGYNHICKSDRYRCFIPNDFLWNTDHDFSRYNVLMFARSIEKIKSEHFIRILEMSGGSIEHIYIEAQVPKPSYLIDWSGKPVMGIFELGWHDIIETMSSFGYKNTYHYRHVGFFKCK